MKKEDIATLRAIFGNFKENLDELAYILSKYSDVPKEFVSAEGSSETIPDDYLVIQEPKMQKPYIKPAEEAILQIGALVEGMEHVTVRGEVTVISPIRTFTKKACGSEGKVKNITIYDKTGSVVIPIWDKQVDQWKDLYAGDVLEVHAFRVEKWKSVLQLKLGKEGYIKQIGTQKGEQHIL